MEYLDWMSHVLAGVVAAVLGVLAQRTWARRRWRRAPAALLNEAVLAVDLVNSTHLASHHGDGVAMRTRNLLERRTLAGVRHGAAINKAFRLVSVPADAFVAVEGEERMQPISDRNRVLLDEDAVHELGNAPVSLRKVGVCRLRGFGGYHRVFELGWRSS